jgi:hypothetical protein
MYYWEEGVNACHTKPMVWQDQTIRIPNNIVLKILSERNKNPSGKGKRIISTYIGNGKGFVDNGP